MSYRFWKVLTLSLLCITTLSCTSPVTINTPVNVSEWESRLPGKQGAIKITFTLPERAEAEFQLFDGRSKHKGFPVARVTLSNTNCTTGHLVAISYKKNDSEFYTKYFEKEATWNNTNTVTIAWDIDNKITTTLNNETISIDSYKDIDTIRIASYMAPINIQRIEYLPR